MTRELTPQNVFMDRFVLEAKVQRTWDVPHATWFTLMGIGGGLFVLARLLRVQGQLGSVFGLPLVDLLSFLAIAVGGLILIADLGKPLRFVRALANPRTSWISRGAIADFVFLLLGGLLILPDLDIAGGRPFAFLPWEAAAASAPGRTLEVVAMLAALVVIYYAGQVLAEPRSIPYWHSPAVPLQFFASSVATAMATIMLLQVIGGRPVSAWRFGIAAGALAGLAALVVWHLRTKAEVPGKSHSLDLLLRGRYRALFLGGVLLAGTVVPAALALLAILLEGAREVSAVIVFLLATPAGFFLRLITLHVGVFPPVRSIIPVPTPRR
jgi:formate-dependent nitrite reductase membrane component NrfD